MYGDPWSILCNRNLSYVPHIATETYTMGAAHVLYIRWTLIKYYRSLCMNGFYTYLSAEGLHHSLQLSLYLG